MDETQLLEKRFNELAEESYAKGKFAFTDFLGLMEQNIFSRLENTLSYAGIGKFGGADGCERVMIRFGDPDSLGYEQIFPIACLKLAPAMQKYADALTHRDILGALMNLGIKRSMLGDIVIRDNVAYLFCHEKIAPFIADNLKKAKHTDLVISPCEELPEGALFQTRMKTVLCASERVDLVVAKLYNLSRSESQALVESGKIFIGGRECADGDLLCREGDVISVRGYGKFIFRGVVSLSAKGKYNLALEEYI